MGGQPEARAVCDHFYAAHCYRGMSIRLCMTCGEPDWDDLEAQLREAAERERIRGEVCEAMATFLTHYGQGHGRADDLAEAVRQTLRRPPLEGQPALEEPTP